MLLSGLYWTLDATDMLVDRSALHNTLLMLILGETQFPERQRIDTLMYIFPGCCRVGFSTEDVNNLQIGHYAER